jgi:hypothetical protein
LRYGKVGEAIPDDTIPNTVFNNHQNLCTGILLFDILIANPDRHIGNLKVDSAVNPKRVWIIDHERALCGVFKGDSQARLTSLEDRLGISGGSVTGQNRHCLLDVINTSKYIMDWIHRINTIPRWFIHDACMRIIRVGIDSRTARALCRFLDTRKGKVQTLIKNNKSEFTKIFDWGLMP